jgi:hypothetical protein
VGIPPSDEIKLSKILEYAADFLDENLPIFFALEGTDAWDFGKVF